MMMRTTAMRSVIAGLLVAIAAGIAAAQSEPARPTLPPDEPGFKSIFNGKDLTGWDGRPGFWTVENGYIQGKTTPENRAPGNTFLVWRDGVLKNFELKLKYRILTGNNSGVQYRSKETKKWVISGYQAEVENRLGKTGFLYHEKGRGWLVNVGDIMEISKDGKKQVVGKVADVNELKKAPYHFDKDWNEYHFLARGNHVMHYLNGYQTIELIDYHVDEKNPKSLKQRCMEGVLAVQIHGGGPMTVQYKDIRLKPLEESFGEAKRLFNGKDLTGWTFSSDGQKDNWSVEGGVLKTAGKGNGYIRTTEDYTNFVLRMQIRHAKKGNSGVLVRMVGEDKVWPKSIEAQGMAGDMGDIWNIDKVAMTTDPARTEGRRARKLHESNENPVGQWNDYEIYLNKGDLRIYVNRLLQNTASDCAAAAGKICLQSEGTPVEFRNIVLIPILDAKSAGK